MPRVKITTQNPGEPAPLPVDSQAIDSAHLEKMGLISSQEARMTPLGPRPPQSIFSFGSKKPAAAPPPARPLPVQDVQPRMLGGLPGQAEDIRSVEFGRRPVRQSQEAFRPEDLLDVSQRVHIYQGMNSNGIRALPLASEHPGADITLKVARTSPGPLLRTTGADLLDGRDVHVRISSGQAMRLYSDGSGWWIL